MLNRISTGINGIDQVIDYLRLGDNIVWQIESIADYRRFVTPFIKQALADERAVYYVRFGAHEPLIEPDFAGQGITVFDLKASGGFENFTSQLYELIGQAGKKAFYVFDCLSDLLNEWSSDLMIGNFFRIVCPYLFELDTVTYFALRRGAHSFDTIARIRETTQLLIDHYHYEARDYIHPLKVWQRYSPTMFMPHELAGDQCIPMTNSADTASLFAGINSANYQAERKIDYWDRLFLDAENLHSEKQVTQDAVFDRLCALLIGDESKINRLAHEFLDLDDLIQIKQRQIGTGKIGGKAVGMLLARKIISQKTPGNVVLEQTSLEPHDSFYLGSDLFYTYIVQNGWWKLRMEQKTSAGYFEKAQVLKEEILGGGFPPQIREQFQQMLEYFGQAPIIVRSSSLLEDNFGNAFAGKYESVFCANQGSPEERYSAFEQAVRRVYASTMDESALNYRLMRGLNKKDEQMALLVQRVSGSYNKHYFYPHLAGVGHSDNLYVWNKLLDPKVGMLRLVFGLGTRAVDRVAGDYPRTVALDYPLLSTHDSEEAEKTYSQHYVDLLDLEKNALVTMPLDDLISDVSAADIADIAEIDREGTKRLASLGYPDRQHWFLNFHKVLSEKSFTECMRTIMEVLQDAYQYPVDIEFTVNRTANQVLMINILQCRPLQTRQFGPSISIPENIDIRNIIIRSNGQFMGGNVRLNLKYIIYVNPAKYAVLTERERYQTARIVGQLNQLVANPEAAPTLLLGPGRWGTTTPTLGVPVRFSEINNIVALGEVAFETAGMMPEISFGSHFFQDLVETNIFYLAVLAQNPGNLFNTALIEERPNLFAKYLPHLQEWQNTITVCEFPSSQLILYSDIISQKLLCYLQNGMDPQNHPKQPAKPI
jgi:pyruvate, water dikinase